MSISLGTNIASMQARRQLHAVGVRQEAGFRRLASGLRIATAADDPSGLGISNRMRAELRSWDASVRNLGDGISVAGVYDGALVEVSGVLGRMRELAVGAASGTHSTEDVAIMDAEFQALEAELARLASDTEFNGFRLLGGTLSGFRISATPQDDDVPFALTDVRPTTLGIDLLTLGAPGPDPLAALDAAIERVASARARGGADLSRLRSALARAEGARESLGASDSRRRAADLAEETALVTRDRILGEASVAMLAQANAQPRLALELLAP